MSEATNIMHKSAAVASLYEAKNTAFREEQEAGAELLDAVLYVLHADALRMLCSRTDGLNEHAVELLRAKDGTVLLLTSAKRWMSLADVGALLLLTSEQVALRWDTARVIQAINEKLDQQIRGGLTKRINDANARAAQFRALATLLRGSK